MRIPIAATVFYLREDELRTAFIVRLGGVDDRRQEGRADETLRKHANEIAAIHREFKSKNLKLKRTDHPIFIF
jgi:hypothetical protein